jgi:carbonic anhydrase
MEAAMNYDRRAFLLQAGVGLALSAAAPGVTVAATAAAQTDAKGALAQLMAGNARFVADRATCPPLTARRIELAGGQHPFAVILSCSDSRVPVETVFDQVPGNIFGIRLAGNFVDRGGLGSIEYAVEHLGSPLILVLGHTECGAVTAAFEYDKDSKPLPGSIQFVVDQIAPGIKGAATVSAAVAENVRDSMEGIHAQSTIVSSAVKAGKATIAGGVYDLRSGKVTLLS